MSKKRNRNAFVETEADEDSAEESDSEKKIRNDAMKKLKANINRSDDEDEEEDDEMNEEAEKEFQGFIADPEEDEVENENDQSSASSESADEEIDDDDLDLVEENQKPRAKKRVQIEKDEDGDDDEQSDHQESFVNLQRDEMNGDLRAGNEQDEDDEDDFIVDDEDRPLRRSGPSRMENEPNLIEAQEIFGDDFNFEDFKYDDLQNEELGDSDDEEDEEEDYEEELDAEPLCDEDGNIIETEATILRRRRERRRQLRQEKVEVLFEPEELQRGYLTESDIVIRCTDKPERFQLRRIPVTEAKEDELEDEANWIHLHAFLKPTISHQPIDERKKQDSQTKKKIANALSYMRNDLYEVPFIAFYRKEHIEPDLDIDDLWKIWEWDEKWMNFKMKKDNLLLMFERMKNYRNYQYEQLGDTNEDALTMKLLTDCEIDRERLFIAQTIEEVEDLREQFNAYYNDDVPAMRLREKILAYREEQKKINSTIDEDEQTLIETFRRELNIKAKPMVKSDYYSVCKQAHLEGLVKKFGLKPDKFGVNLHERYQKHEIDQYPIGPLKTCEEFVCKQFPTVQAVFQAAKFMHARQLSLDPVVRQVVRRDYFTNCMVNVRPTKNGFQTITEEHPCFSMKYLIEKPVKTFNREEFLNLIQARDDGLVQLEYVVDRKTSQNGYAEEMKRSYVRDEYSDNVQEWNEARAECIDIMLNKFLFPKFQKELEETLLEEARKHVLSRCSDTLNSWIKVAPYRLSEDENVTSVSEIGIELVSIAYATEPDDVSFAVALDADGQVLNYLRLPNLMLRDRAGTENQAKRQKDFRALRAFFIEQEPKVVCLGVENRDALFLRKELENMLNTLQQNEQFRHPTNDPIKVLLLDPSIARVYAISKKGESDFPSYPRNLRQAISQGRRIQDPLLEIAQLCNYDKEILLLKYHPLQNLLDRDRLLTVLEQCFISRTNEVGVDVNRALQFGHTSHVLQFVCGFGPRKAPVLLKFFKKENIQLESRTQLVVKYDMGKCVFSNCAGFIKINTDLMDKSKTYIETLDSTRIHPEAYEWARKMAVDALDSEESPDLEPTAALAKIFEDSERLKELDLDAFAVELKNTKYGDQSITLYDIRAELTHRYKDLRARYEPASPLELFAMITKETTETFHVGKLIQCQVFDLARKQPTEEQLRKGQPEKDDTTGAFRCHLCLTEQFYNYKDACNHFELRRCRGVPIGVKVRLDNGCSGFIKLENLSDSRVTNPLARVKIGQTIHCRILDIKVDRFSVELTSRSSDLRDEKHNFRPKLDRYYDHNLESEDLHNAEKENQAKQLAKERSFVKRVIAHPSFMNINYAECEKILAKKDLGDAIIRPSSKAVDHLTITWKIADGILHNIDIQEEQKINHYSLGKRLLIIDPRTQERDEFEDLDEILARYVKPMVNTIADIFSNKYYKNLAQSISSATPNGSVITTSNPTNSTGEIAPLFPEAQKILNNLLVEDKRQNPTRIRYYVSISREYPGRFLLSYMPVRKAEHEYFTVTPNGIRFRSKMFNTLNDMLNWFKLHYNDAAAMVPPSPMRSGSSSVRAAGSSSTHGNNAMSVSSTPIASATPMVSSGFSQPPPPMDTTPAPTVPTIPSVMVSSGFSQPPPAFGTLPHVPLPQQPMMMPPPDILAYFQQYHQQQQQQQQQQPQQRY